MQIKPKMALNFGLQGQDRVGVKQVDYVMLTVAIYIQESYCTHTKYLQRLVNYDY